VDMLHRKSKGQAQPLERDRMLSTTNAEGICRELERWSTGVQFRQALTTMVAGTADKQVLEDWINDYRSQQI